MSLVLLLDPRLGGAVEKLEGELGLTVEHGHQSALDEGKEEFLFAVLLRRLRQGGVVLDGQPLESLPGLSSEHRRAVVAEKRAGQPPLAEGLAQAVDETLGVAVTDVPLRVAAQPRVIVEDRKQG